MGLDAFDEFDEIEISESESQPQAAEAQAESVAAVDELDEDLFAFPAPDLSHVEPVSPEVPAVTAESVAVTTARAQATDQTSVTGAEEAPATARATAPATVPAPAPAPALPSVTASASGASSAPMAEADLDDDLFQFPDVFSGALLATPLEDTAHVSVQSDNFVVDDPSSEPAAETLQDPAAPAPSPIPAPAPAPAPAQQTSPEPQTLQPQSPPVPAAAAPAPAPAPTTVGAQRTPSGGHAPAQPGFDPTPKYQGYQPYLPPSDEELTANAAPAAGRSHLTEILAVGFLVLNVALVLFAYQANTSFHETLAEVTRSVAETLTNNQAQAQERPPTIAFPLPPLTQDPGNQLPDQSADLRLQSMALARRMVEEERYFDARRVLYRLLANRDLAALDEAFVAQAEYLIAESYELQGKALAELQR